MVVDCVACLFTSVLSPNTPSDYGEEESCLCVPVMFLKPCVVCVEVSVKYAFFAACPVPVL